MTTSHTRTRVIQLLLALSFLLSSVKFGRANQPDPTMPSPQIVKRLTLGQAAPTDPSAKGTAAQKIPTLSLRLKGIVLRDNNNGTALLSNGNSEVYVVKLRRTKRDPGTQIEIGGLHLVVKDFSKATVTMHCLETDQRFIAN